MIDSSNVLNLTKLIYVIYLMATVSLFGAYAWSIAGTGRSRPKIKIPFYGWLGLLISIGVGIHIFTFNTLPWVQWDLTRNSIKADREYKIVAANHQFQLPGKELAVHEGQMVRFNVESRDYTYGFGLFRSDGSMVFQMQVVPGAANDIVWKFDKVGVYTIRSTEYSGPRGIGMVCRNAVFVTPASTLVQAKAAI